MADFWGADDPALFARVLADERDRLVREAVEWRAGLPLQTGINPATKQQKNHVDSHFMDCEPQKEERV